MLVLALNIYSSKKGWALDSWASYFEMLEDF